MKTVKDETVVLKDPPCKDLFLLCALLRHLITCRNKKDIVTVSRNHNRYDNQKEYPDKPVSSFYSRPAAHNTAGNITNCHYQGNQQ